MGCISLLLCCVHVRCLVVYFCCMLLILILLILQCHKSSNAHGCFACRLKKEEQKMAKKVEETLRSPLLKDREKRYGTFKAAELVALLHSAGVRVSNKLSKGKCRVELERVVNGEE